MTCSATRVAPQGERERCASPSDRSGWPSRDAVPVDPAPAASSSASVTSIGSVEQLLRPARRRRDEPPGEPEHPGLALDARPSRTSSARRPGSRRCCCRPGPADLVAHRQHRDADGEQRQRQQVPHLALRGARWIAGSSVGPSTPQFQLRFWSLPSRPSSPLASLCLRVVGDEVVEREPVVAGHEVDRLSGARGPRGRRGPGCR